jgi:hypothetical protein
MALGESLVLSVQTYEDGVEEPTHDSTDISVVNGAFRLPHP